MSLSFLFIFCYVVYYYFNSSPTVRFCFLFLLLQFSHPAEVTTLHFLLSYLISVDILKSLIPTNVIVMELFLVLNLKFCLYFWNPIFIFEIQPSILGSQMSPHVMYGSASLFALSYLSLSRGIVSPIIV